MNQILVATVQVTLFSRDGTLVNARFLMDNGSQVSFITEELVSEIQSSGCRGNLDISGISENNIFSNSIIEVVTFSRLNIYTKNFLLLVQYWRKLHVNFHKLLLF